MKFNTKQVPKESVLVQLKLCSSHMETLLSDTEIELLRNLKKQRAHEIRKLLKQDVSQ